MITKFDQKWLILCQRSLWRETVKVGNNSAPQTHLQISKQNLVPSTQRLNMTDCTSMLPKQLFTLKMGAAGASETLVPIQLGMTLQNN
jgi:hypothetical protein